GIIPDGTTKIGEGIYTEFGSMFSLVGCQAIRTKNIKKLTDKQREALLGLEEPHEVTIAWLENSDGLLRLRSLVDRGRWRFMDSEGVITTIPSRYAHVRQAVDGVAIVVMGGFGPTSNVYKEGIIDTKGNELTPIKYDSIGFFKDGVAEVRIGQERGIINNKGVLVEPLTAKPNCSTRSQFVVDGDNAERVYNIFKESHFAKSHNALGFNTQIEFDYADGILRIEEHTDANSLVAELLCFFVGYDNFYSLTEYYDDGEVQDCELHDDEGKYFYNKNNTNYENLENN
ncbi:MAG: WG repeat-containing protein, partial [Alistipes sp.]|nr:WG repeat-containing protein [Alistipes sp.]